MCSRFAKRCCRKNFGAASTIVRSCTHVSLVTRTHTFTVLTRPTDIRSFIRFRRFETFSLHQIIQEFRCNDVAWLSIPHVRRQPASDAIKLRQLCEELVFWFFDGLVMPILQGTFYITETAASRYKTVYFRHDDWTALCRPALQRLKEANFIKLDDGRQNFLKRTQPAATVLRLLPKPNGLRPIANLGKRNKKVGKPMTPSAAALTHRRLTGRATSRLASRSISCSRSHFMLLQRKRWARPAGCCSALTSAPQGKRRRHSVQHALWLVRHIRSCQDLQAVPRGRVWHSVCRRCIPRSPSDRFAADHRSISPSSTSKPPLIQSTKAS